MDELHALLQKQAVEIVDPADEYNDDYYTVFFRDPDSLKPEGMKYGKNTAKKKAARARAKPNSNPVQCKR